MEPTTPPAVPVRYRDLTFVGRGGMGTVWRAYDSEVGRPVALKVLRSHAAADPTFRARFKREMRVLAQVTHPCIVKVLDVSLLSESLCLVLEYVPGQRLDLWAAAQRPDWSPIVRRFVDLADALAALHEAKVLHRDVKPSNVLVSEDGTPKLLDLGLAMPLDEAERTRLTETGFLVGTPAYVAPEVLNGYPATERSDVYSLGVTLFECLTGRLPIEPPQLLELLRRRSAVDPRTSVSLCAGLPPALGRAVQFAIAVAPEQRMRCAADLRAALAATLASPAAAVTSHGTMALPQPWRETSAVATASTRSGGLRRLWTATFTVVALLLVARALRPPAQETSAAALRVSAVVLEAPGRLVVSSVGPGRAAVRIRVVPVASDDGEPVELVADLVQPETRLILPCPVAGPAIVSVTAAGLSTRLAADPVPAWLRTLGPAAVPERELASAVRSLDLLRSEAVSLSAAVEEEAGRVLEAIGLAGDEAARLGPALREAVAGGVLPGSQVGRSLVPLLHLEAALWSADVGRIPWGGAGRGLGIRFWAAWDPPREPQSSLLAEAAPGRGPVPGAWLCSPEQLPSVRSAPGDMLFQATLRGSMPSSWGAEAPRPLPEPGDFASEAQVVVRLPPGDARLTPTRLRLELDVFSFTRDRHLVCTVGSARPVVVVNGVEPRDLQGGRSSRGPLRVSVPLPGSVLRSRDVLVRVATASSPGCRPTLAVLVRRVALVAL